MKTAVPLLVLISVIVLIGGCVQDVCMTKEDCPDKTCFVKDCVDNNCSYSEILPCCGNAKCEPGETYEECVGDCIKTGYFKESEVWGGTIHVTGDIEFEEGTTLTILSGTVIEVAAMSDDQHGGVDHAHDTPFPKDPDRIETQSTRIIIKGILNATGTPDNRIIFTSDSDNPTTYDWDGLSISHGKLEYAIVEYSRYNNFQESSDVIVANNIFRNMLECCICIGHNGAISPQILYNDIYNCGHECIDYAGGSALIKGNHFHLENPEIQPDPSNGGVGIIVYRNAYPTIEDNVFEKHSRAIFFLDNALNEEEPGNQVMVRNNTMKNNNIDIDMDPGYPIDVIVMEKTGYVRDCSFEVGENVPIAAEITYNNTLVSTSNDGYFSINVEGDPELLITADGYHDYIETPSRMVNNAFYLIPDNVYEDLYSVVWEEQIYNTNNWMRKWTRQPEIIIAKEKGINSYVNTVVSALSGDVFNRMTGGLYSAENITILDELPEELYELENRDGKIIIYFANEMMDGSEVAGGAAYSRDNEDGDISFSELVLEPSSSYVFKFSFLHELTHAITTGGHINYKASIVSEIIATPNVEPSEADYKFLNCIYNSPLKRSN